MKLRSVDLFAGAGGLTQGLKRAGFECVYANEFDIPAAATFAFNHPDTLVDTRDITSFHPSEIREKLGLEKGELDLVAGGPPCQGFSTYGQRDSADPRNQLYISFFAFIEEFRPRAFIMENVSGLLSMDGGAVVEDIMDRANALGYRAQAHLLSAQDYGVPQKRKRVFIVGSVYGSQIPVIPPTHGERLSRGQTDLFNSVSPIKDYVTVRAAIGDLMNSAVLPPSKTQLSLAYPEIDVLTDYQKRMREGSLELTHHSCKRMLGIRRLRLALLKPGDYGREMRETIKREGLPYEVIDEFLNGHEGSRNIEECRAEDKAKEQKLRELLHSSRCDIEEILRTVDPGGFANKYRRLKWEEPSHTLVAHMARDCSDFVHPELDRFISVREAARLQSFADCFKFPGSQFQQFKQIGNAVPPLLGYAIGYSIFSFLADSSSSSVRSSI